MSNLHHKRLKASELAVGMKVRWLKGSHFSDDVMILAEVENQGKSNATVVLVKRNGKRVWNPSPGNRFVLISMAQKMEGK